MPFFRALYAERKALRALYTATQGPGWFEQGGWETNDADLSAWYGVCLLYTSDAADE